MARYIQNPEYVKKNNERRLTHYKNNREAINAKKRKTYRAQKIKPTIRAAVARLAFLKATHRTCNKPTVNYSVS